MRAKRKTLRELIVDSFAGGGGASQGITLALGRGPDLAINHDAEAIAMHAANHPGTRHMTEDVWRINPRKATRGRRVALLWASPDCRHFSRAKGGKPVEKKIRSLAWVVVKWAAEVKPAVIMLENVREFADWGPIVPAWKCRGCGWRGTEGQLAIGRSGALPLRPRCPSCGARRMVISEELIPDPKRKGVTFRRFCGRLRALGYVVDHKNLNAADFGAPTHRRRLFLVARRDGQPIEWPEPTHADPKKLDALPLFERLKPWRTAAECIDWTLPCPSIFERPRPLAEATMRRIAMGIKRYVLENPQPFIVGVGGRMGQSPASPSDEPSNTVTGKNDRAIVTPYLVSVDHTKTTGRGRYDDSLGDPLKTVTQSNGKAIIAPTLIQIGYGERDGQAPRVPGLDKPHGSIVAGGGKSALVTAFLAKHFGGNTTPGSAINAPVDTITATDHNSLVSVWLAKHFGGKVGVPIDTPFPTITAMPHQNQIVAANLVRMNFGEKSANGADEPLPTVTSQTNKLGLVYSFLVRYFGTAIGQHVTEPIYTITGKDRFGLVVVQVNGEPYVIADIGMRMLTPRELARAQGFPDGYVLTGTKRSQVAKIGNSVCPAMAEALVRANLCGVAAAV